MHWFLDPIQYHYRDFEGRAGRREFWMFALYFSLITLAGVGLVALTKLVMAALILVFWLSIVLPVMALTIRRLHDAGYTGWLLMLIFVPYVGVVALLILCLLPSEGRRNRYDQPAVSETGAT